MGYRVWNFDENNKILISEIPKARNHAVGISGNLSLFEDSRHDYPVCGFAPGTWIKWEYYYSN